MNGKAGAKFVDTNVLVYAHDKSDREKHRIAQTVMQSLWQSGSGRISIQVLQEFYVTITRKVEKPLSQASAADIIADFSAWPIHSPSLADIENAISIQARYGLSFWDAMIIRSSVVLNCDTLLSEDPNAGQIYHGVVVVNPFRTEVW